ncbi:hypothetical protein C8F04DRAFT_1398200 [Mycena alexandri]|uniref:Uncharacterized protein n=1 Tax=Mycena alexandri TaxID=1745969 RepID=A0AAD6SP83_9AGAR|nr:hypothetical protein C8F04DRAFT_1398200 [Mycena alexandri]
MLRSTGRWGGGTSASYSSSSSCCSSSIGSSAGGGGAARPPPAHNMLRFLSFILAFSYRLIFLPQQCTLIMRTQTTESFTCVKTLSELET